MKTSNKIILTSLLFVAATYLCLLFAAKINMVEVEKLKGNGNVTTVNKSIQAFDKLRVSNKFEVEIVQGEPALSISLDENLQEIIEVNQNGSELSLVLDDYQHPVPSYGSRVKVRVSTPNITNIIANGGSKVWSDSLIRAPQLKLRSSGAASIKLTVESDKIEAKMSGAGNVTLNGNAQRMNLRSSGAGQFNGENITINDVEISANGASKISIHAVDFLNVYASGASVIEYKGNPKVEQSTSGASRVSPMK